MRIPVIFAVAQLFHQRCGRIADMQRDRAVRRVVPDLSQSRVDRHVGRVALGARGQVDRRFGQRDASFGHADLVHRVEAGVGEQQPVRIGQPDVFRGEDYEPPRDELRVLASGEHAGQIIDRRVRVAAAHRFDVR